MRRQGVMSKDNSKAVVSEEELLLNYCQDMKSIDLFGAISTELVLAIKGYLDKLNFAWRNKKNRDETNLLNLTVTINSAGGEAEQGLAFYDLFKTSKMPVTTVALGKLASAGLIAFLGGKIRYIYPHTVLMTHAASYALADFEGSKRSGWYRGRGQDLKILDRICDQIILNNSKLTKSALARLQREERLITAEEAMRYGLAHGIIKNR